MRDTDTPQPMLNAGVTYWSGAHTASAGTWVNIDYKAQKVFVSPERNE